MSKNRYNVYLPGDLWIAAQAEVARRNAEESHLGRASISALLEAGLRIVLLDAKSKAKAKGKKKPPGPPGTARRCRCGHWERFVDFAEHYPGRDTFPSGEDDLSTARDCRDCRNITK